MKREFIGLILAGGKARRFGGGKALSLLKGRPLVLWVRDRLAPLCKEVWLSLRSPSQPELCLQKYFQGLVFDRDPGQGPLSGLLSGLKKLDQTKCLIVATCDQPLIQTPLLKHLKIIFEKRDLWGIFCVSPKGVPEPFPGIYGPELTLGLEAYLSSGKKSVRAWLQSLPPKKVLGLPYEVWYPWDKEGLSFININYREDLERIKKRLL